MRLLLALVALGVVESVAPLEQTFKSGVRLVPIFATVRDAHDRLVGDLEERDFRVFVDGQRVEIELFDS